MLIHSISLARSIRSYVSVKKLRRLEDLIVKGKRVLVRVDFNVPLHKGKVTDELRIASALPTIKYLIAQKAIVVLASHLGRPDGKPIEKYSLEPVAISLSELLGREVMFLHDCVGEDITSRVNSLRPGQVALLENLRFHPEEEANDPAFARSLANLADVYVDDAFAVAHRAHASIVGVPKFLPHAVGKLMQAEVETLTSLMERPKPPFVAVIGGAKIADKIEFLRNLMKQADTIVISGAMANTFLAALGHNMRDSLQDKGGHKTALAILAEAKKRGVEVILPVDVVVAKKIASGVAARTVTVGQLEEGDRALDIGIASTTNINIALQGVGTILWNGTLGMTEYKEFVKASQSLAEHMARSSALTVIGGGDTAGFIDGIGYHDKFSFVSTGGGAALELLAGKPMPALSGMYIS
ncbi:phosphoglycerate kinase [Candidatus Saccharibacteria bacterium]|nr:phosphoglycerate kinase [Candidatus Saccharibacteria bacterium]